MKRVALSVGLVTLGLGCGAEPASAPPPRVVEPAAAPTGPVIAPPVAAPVVPVALGEERCEGLVGSCGGWLGCVHVRTDPSAAEHFVGVGENAGHFYTANHDCFEGVCNEVCTGGSESACRPGVTEDQSIVVCSVAVAPMRAPFTCRLEGSACIQGPDPAMIPAS